MYILWYIYSMSVRFKCFPKLYIGDSIDGRKLMFIKHRIRHGKGGYCVIVPSEKDDEMLDIIEAKYLIKPLYDGKRLVLGGIAANKSEAIKLVCLMTEDCQRIRGDLNLKEFIACGQYL